MRTDYMFIRSCIRIEGRDFARVKLVKPPFQSICFLLIILKRFLCSSSSLFVRGWFFICVVCFVSPSVAAQEMPQSRRTTFLGKLCVLNEAFPELS